jgi:hypothetical protein
VTWPVGSASGRVTGGHDPVRPGWICVRCGNRWPCPGARVFLTTAYAHDPLLLGMYLSTQLFTAAADFGVAELTPELLARFLTWARTAQPSTNPNTDPLELEVGL